FRYDSVMLAVSSTSPANNSVVTLPFTTLDVNFNEPVAAASIGVSDVVLSRGTVTGATAVDADTVRYTLSGITGETNLTFTMAAFITSLPAATAGQYKVTVTALGSTTGTARVELNLGAIYETESHDGAANNPDAFAQAIGPAFAPLGAQAGQDRTAVLGTVAS